MQCKAAYVRRRCFYVPEAEKREYAGLPGCPGGVLIILALVLPAGFWWFALAIALICGGIWLLRCR